MSDWLNRPEDQWFERKSFRIKPKDLARTIVAFANAEGGTIVVGIRDGAYEGTPTAKQDNDLRQTSLDHTDPTVRVKIETVTPEQGILIYLFVIEPSQHVHFLNSGECYLRVGDESRHLKHDDILELRYTKGDQQFDATSHHGAQMSALDDEQVADYAERIGSSSPMDALRARNLIDLHGNPRTAAVLLFGRRPQDYFLNAYVRVIVWREVHRLPGRQQQILADERFEGSLPHQIGSAQRFIDSHLPTVRRLNEVGRFSQETLIPHDVWLEGLVNAVIHRSYSMIGDHIRFEIFPDRLVISSPGRFPGLADPRKPETITRFARNPLIARVMSELNIGQELGEGIRRIYAGMRSVGFTDPVYEQTSGSVLLTLNAVQRVHPQQLAALPRHSETVLEALQQQNAPLSTGEVAQYLGLSTPSVRKALQALRDAGYVTWHGSSPRDPRATWRAAMPLR